MIQPIKYKETGLEWCPQIPKHWELKKLKYISTLRNEVLDESDFTIAVENIESGTGLLVGIDNTKELSGTLNHFYKDDILFNKLRPYLHKVYFATKEGGAYGELLIIKSDISIISKFLFYKLFSKSFINVVNGFTQGSKMPRANWDGSINLLPIAYPKSKKEQQKIADYLDQKTTLIDSIISKKEKQIELYKEERIAVINRAVTKGLNPDVEMKESGIEWLGTIPKHWQVKKLKYIIKFYNSSRIPLSSEERGVMKSKKYDYYGASGVIDKVENYIFDGTYILLGEDGANLLTRSTKLAFIARGKFWVNNHAHILKPFIDNLFYIAYQLEDIDYTSLVSGSAQPKLTLENLSSVDLVIPPLSEQQEIVTYLDKETNRIDTLVCKTSKQIELLKEYKEALINEVVTGQRIID